MKKFNKSFMQYGTGTASLVLALALSAPVASFAQDTPAKDLELKQQTGPGFAERFDFSMGLMGGINIPGGEVANAVGMGFGGSLFADFRLPIKLTSVIDWRARISGGYYTHAGAGGEFDGTLNLMPFIATLRMAYPTPSGFIPYFGLGLGITYVTVSGDAGTDPIPDNSSVDATLAVSLGAGYIHASIPKVQFFVDASYILAFETVTGQFASVSLGAAFRFDPTLSPKPASGTDATASDKPAEDPKKNPKQPPAKNPR